MSASNSLRASVEAAQRQVDALQVSLDGLRQSAVALAEHRQRFVADMERVRLLAAEIESTEDAERDRLALEFDSLVACLKSEARRLSDEVTYFQQSLMNRANSAGVFVCVTHASRSLLKSAAIKIAVSRMANGPASTTSHFNRP